MDTDTLQALLGLGDCLRLWGSELLLVTDARPDLTPEIEADARSQARQVFAQAAHTYEQVDALSEAACSHGNVLTQWAECCPPDEAAGLLSQAVAVYRSVPPEAADATMLGNLADALVQQGDAMCDAGQGGGADVVFRDAAQTYRAAWAACHAEEDADAAVGVLCNWGAGLLAMARHATDGAVAGGLLQEALQRLGEAAARARPGDVDPLNGLGDAWVASAEKQPPQQALASLRAAADQGYRAALTISRHNMEATLGMAEVNMAAGRLAPLEVAGGHFADAAAGFGRALSTPEKISGGVQGRLDVRYNWVCALMRCGRQEQAAAALAELVRQRPSTALDAAKDEDFKGVQDCAWFLNCMKLNCK